MHDTPSFHSRFALEQLQRIAAQFSAKSFEALTVAVFGRRVSAEQYLTLHSDLLADALPNPGYRVLDDSDASGAVYDPADGTIQLPRSVIEQALRLASQRTTAGQPDRSIRRFLAGRIARQ